MIRKIIFPIIGAVLFGQIASSQPKVSGKPQKFLSISGETLMNAVWSPDGKSVAFTSDRHNGLWKCNANGKNISQITKDTGAGFGFLWSADSKTILARPSVIENSRRFHYVKTYDVESGQETIILEKSRELNGMPVWCNNDSRIAMLLSGQIKKVNSGKPALKSSSVKESESVLLGGLLVASPFATKSEIVFPQFKGRYVFNSRISPQGNKIVFQVSGLGLYVSNLDGTDLKHLGFGEHASWMPDNKFIIVTMVKDDGQIVTSGFLFAVNVDSGDYYPLLNDPSVIALKPSVSPDGKKLLFDNLSDGSIYLLNLQ